MDPQHGHFSVKMYVKMKELGPVGGGVRPARPPPQDPSMLVFGLWIQQLVLFIDVLFSKTASYIVT